MLDLYLLPLNLAGGNEEQYLPGLLAARPGKKTERSRANDIFIILLSLVDGPPSYPQDISNNLHHLAATYFRTRGSITSGLQAVAEELNKCLLKHNLNQPKEEAQTLGLVNLMVLRRDQLYIANAGPTHTILLNETQIEDFHDPVDAGRGLGISRAIQLKFYRAQVKHNDLILLCAKPAEKWTKETFQNSTKISLDNLRRRLISQAGSDLEAAVMQFKPGEGEIHFLKPRVPEAVETAPESRVEDKEPAPAVQEVLIHKESQEPHSEIQPEQTPPEVIPSEPEVPEATGTFPRPIPQVSPFPQVETPPSPPVQPRGSEVRRPQQRPAYTPPPGKSRSKPAVKPQPKLVKKVTESKKANWKRKFADSWLSFRADIHRTQDRFLTFAGRLLPGSTEPGENLSPDRMLMIAVIVPILVVAIATTFYFYQGRGGQREELLQSAQQSAALAENETDLTLKLNHWAQTIHWLDQADEFGQSEQSIALRLQAQNAIDSIDGIIRLDFEPILTDAFNSSIKITKIDSSTTDIYLFDQAGSRILRLFLTGEGYKIDTDFDCGSIPPVEKLVDFVTLPPGAPFNATVLATDSKGNYIYCTPDSEPAAQQFIPPDNFSWGEISHITLDANHLYVLDPEKNGLWVIPASMDPNNEEVQVLNFSEYSPVLIFTNYVPKLKDIIDIAVNGEDIYLLHDDGQMTLCNTNVLAFGQTNCTDPALYDDPRPGKEKEVAAFTGVNFTHILSTQPPEPSLFILDADGQIINQFSLQLNLRRQLRPSPNDQVFLTNEHPTAFTITNTRVAFIAFGNILYEATLP